MAGHPFDVELSRIPAGKRGYPLHSHTAQTEYYIILDGPGLLSDYSGSRTRIKSKDHFICKPGEAHRILNDGASDLVYYVIADDHRADVTTYPATDKRQIKPELDIFGSLMSTTMKERNRTRRLDPQRFDVWLTYSASVPDNIGRRLPRCYPTIASRAGPQAKFMRSQP